MSYLKVIRDIVSNPMVNSHAIERQPFNFVILNLISFFYAFVAASKRRVGTIIYGQYNYLLKVGYKVIRETITKWLNIECF
jgi:hypothetical protein